VRLQIGRGVDVIKIATTGGVNSGTGRARMAFDDETKALIDTAHMYGRKVAVHAHGVAGVNAALAAGADSIEHGTEMDAESLRLFKRGGGFYVPTLSTVNGYLSGSPPTPTPMNPRCWSRSAGGSASPASRSAWPMRPASRSPSAPMPACPSTAATPMSSNSWSSTA
jgi:hypothetical protein